MKPFLQSDPRPEFRRYFFKCADTAALGTLLQASDMGTVVVKAQKNGVGTVATTTNSRVECDATDLKGEFYVEFTAAELNTPGVVNIKITSTGGTKIMDPVLAVVDVEPAVMFTVVTGSTLTTTVFKTNLTSAVTDKYKGMFATFFTGPCADETPKVLAYNGTTKEITVSTAMTAVPTVGDFGRLVNR